MIRLLLKSIASIVFALVLSACGGSDGTDNAVVAEYSAVSPLSSGTITQFGSVFVNGVEFETDNALFDIDGTAGIQADLSIGMIVDVHGSIDPSEVTGTATLIDFGDRLQGPVRGLTLPLFDGTKKQFTVLGTTVCIHSTDTIFDISGQGAIPLGTPFDFDTISADSNVGISGFFDSFGFLNVTRIELKETLFNAASVVKVSGTISALTNTQFTLDTLSVESSSARLDNLPDGLVDGGLVRVKGTFDIATNTITATQIEGETSGIVNAKKASIEGMITDFIDFSQFKLGETSIDASSAIFTPSTLTLSNNIRIEAEGPVVGGVLKAISIKLRGGEDRVHALISSVDPANNQFEVTPVETQPAIRITITASTEIKDDVGKISPFGISDLVIGDFAEIRGFVDGASLTANRIRIRDKNDVIVKGIRQPSTTGFIKILGVEFTLEDPGETGFQNAQNSPISQALFDQEAPANNTAFIKIKDREVPPGSGRGNGIADVVEIEPPFTAADGVIQSSPTPIPAPVDLPIVTPPPVVPLALVGTFTITGTATPGDTVIITNANGDPLATTVADINGDWSTIQPLDTDLYPNDGEILTAASTSGDTATFTFQGAGPLANIDGTGTLVITNFGTTLGIPVRPDPVNQAILANFIGEFEHLGGLTPLFKNDSRVDRERLDIIIADVPRELFVNTGDAFGDTGAGLGEQLGAIGVANSPGTIGVGDEIAVDRFTAVFTDNIGDVIRSFAEDNVQIVAQEILDTDGVTITGARQDVVWVLWSIRFNDVTSLAGATHVALLLDADTATETLLAESDIAGDVTANFAQGVTFANIVNNLPATAALPLPAPLVPVNPVVPGVGIGGTGTQGQTGYLSIGDIVDIKLVDQTDRFSAGTLTLAGGEIVVIPRNLILTLPANWLTLQEFADQAPAAEKISGIGVGHVATIMGNRQANGIVIAGDVFLHKNDQERQGIVTFINLTEGYFRINGNGNDTGGTMVRPNDPDAVHSVQSGAGISVPIINNGSPDIRYTNDPTNYTFSATTGYPIGLNGPNLAINSGRAGGESSVALDASRFEPLMVGDFVHASGSIETIGGVTFQSAHTIGVGISITTAPGDPDHILVDEAEWDVAGWANQRLKGLNIGMMTSNAAVTIYRLAHNGATDAPGVDADGNLAQLIASTDGVFDVGGDATSNAAAQLGNGVGQVIKIVYDWDFVAGESKIERNPGEIVDAAGDPSGLLDPTESAANNAFRVFAPVAREIVYKTTTWEAAVDAFAATPITSPDPATMVTDVQGNPAQWGQYLSPNGIGHPEWGEIDLTRFSTPFIFEGELWNLDRRLGPVGGGEDIATNPLGSFPLDPFPTSGLSVDQDFGPGGFAPTNLELISTDMVTGTDLGLSTETAADAGAKAIIILTTATAFQ